MALIETMRNTEMINRNVVLSNVTKKFKRTSLQEDIYNLFNENQNNELGEYEKYVAYSFELPKNPEDFNLFEFWRKQQQTYPTLSLLAKKYLSIQPSSV